MFGWSICLTILCVKGGERHVWDVEKLGVDNLAQVQLLNWLSQVFGILGIAAGKVSVSALLLTMLRLTDLRWHRIYLWIVTIGLTSAIAVSCSFLTMLQCSPPAALWDPRIQGKCIDSRVMSGYGIFTGAFNTFADGSLAILPTTVILSLANSPIKKLQLTIVFGLNILTCICSGIKTQYLAQLANRTDFTWATFDIFAWVTVEFFLMIVCGTILTLHGLLIAIQSTTEVLKDTCSCGTWGNSNGNTGDGGLRIEQKDVARCDEQVTIGRMATRKPGWDNAQGGRSSECLFQDL
ncbi:hypothetical protein SLS64_002286 [Diaporthe eres]|uniref:Rhodopsin domain-containing protein n=1 Tax=Diaporthe eres TaxID=83184 RepID=A0ABR1PGJ1_DIAER